MSKYLYAFSADPITKGHRNVIERILHAHPNDELIIGIGVNPDKKYLFTLAERKAMAKEYLSDLNVQVISFKGMLTDYAIENGISVIYRGVRDTIDIGNELNLFYTLRMQTAKIEVHFIPAHEEMTTISSSAVKAIVKEYGDVSKFVSTQVKAALEAKILGQYVLCITGEICSGKTYMLNRIQHITASRGITTHHLDLDILGHQILEELTEDLYVNTRLEIATVFGNEVINSDGFINRSILGEIVFSEPSFMETLNDIMREAMLIRIARERARFGEGLILVDGALIVEFNWESKFNDNVWLLDTDSSIRMSRLKHRNLTDIQIANRENCQFITADKILYLKERKCEFTYIKNPHTMSFKILFERINKLIQTLDIYGELRFKGLWKRIKCDGEANNAYKNLMNKYSESHRYYHTILHITNGLNEIWNRAIDDEKYNLDKVEFAWWYHDSIYDKQSRVNEMRSAIYAKSVCEKCLLEDSFTNAIYELIIDTAHNRIPNTYDGKFICDIDLLIFTADKNIFNEYENNIRKEYSWVDNNVYLIARKNILNKFYNKFGQTTSAYYTLNESYDFKAARNLTYMLEQLDYLYGE